MTRTVMHLSPHPDDEMIGAPAALMALRDEGWTVLNVACSLGREPDWPRRLSELREACLRAGFRLHEPVGSINISSDDDLDAAELELRSYISQLVREVAPDIVVSPSPHDRHHGHEVVARATRSALSNTSMASPVWWMWGLWGQLPIPSVAVGFGEERMREVLHALEAYGGELERNDYRRLVEGRARMYSSLGPELVFGFGKPAGTDPYAEVLTEVHRVGGQWLLSEPRWLQPGSATGVPGPSQVGGWLADSSVTARHGSPGRRGSRP